MNKVVIYPGCNSQSIESKHIKYVKQLLKKLDIDYIVLKEFSCCGGSHLEDVSEKKAMLLNARNISYAQKHSDILLTICGTCYMTLNRSYKTILKKENKKNIDKALTKIDLEPIKSNLKIFHILNFLCQPEILKKIEQKKKNSRIDKKVLTYYGCHIKRPSKFLPENPEGNLEKIFNICGIKAPETEIKYECCGFHAALTNNKNSKIQIEKIVKEAKQKNCSTIATACTLCNFNINSNIKLNQKIKAIPFEKIILDSLK